MTISVIGISGNYESGKDTFGNMLIKELGARGIKAKRFAYADKLKEFAKEYFGWDGNKEPDFDHLHMYSPEQGGDMQVLYIGGRRLLQGIGQMMRDLIGKSFWVDVLMKDIEHCSPTIAVITDMRYVTEIDMVRSLGGLTIKVTRPGHTGDDHSSETEQNSKEFMTEIDECISNDKSWEDLRKHAARIAGQIFDAGGRSS